MHALSESCFEPSREVRRYVLQAFRGAAPENLQHRNRQKPRSTFRINGLCDLHGRLARLAILKHTGDISAEALFARLVENPYFQFFCGEEFFRHDLPFDHSSLTRWRLRAVVWNPSNSIIHANHGHHTFPPTEGLQPLADFRVMID